MWLVKKVRKERELCLCVCTEWGERWPGFKGENNDTCQASCLIDYIPQPPKY